MPNAQDVLLDYLDFFGQFLEVFQNQLEEMQKIQRAVLAIGFTVDDMAEQLAWMEDGNENRNGDGNGVGKIKGK